MAQRCSLREEHNSNDYYKYKTHEKNALQILLPANPCTGWSVNQIYHAAKQAVPLLGKRQLNSVVSHLQQSTQAREKFSLRFRFAPMEIQNRHANWADMIGRIFKLAKSETARHQRWQGKLTTTESVTVPHQPITNDLISERCLGDRPTAEQEHHERLEDADISADKAIFLRFLEDIELCIAQAEALWKRVAAGKMHLSTASMLTNTYLCTVNSIINAEMLLNPSWFMNDRLATSPLGVDCPYWTELQVCVNHIEDVFYDVVVPTFTSKMPFIYAPLLTHMLTKMNDFSAHATVSDVPLVAAVAASLACRCQGLSLSIKELRSSVKTQILSTETMLRHHRNVYKDSSHISEILSHMEYVKEWATLCRDAVSFGQMMSWLKVQRVLCIRLFIHDSCILQLFAYICERIRLNGECLPTALEVLLNDQRTSGFLFLDGRPKRLEDCKTGIERWSDPGKMLDNISLTQHIFSKRSKPTVAQQIIDGGGRMTKAMIYQLNSKPLEDYLSWELDPPDPIRLEAILLSAACSIAEKSSIKSKPKFKCDGAVWFFVRTKVLYRPEMEKLLLSRFMDKYVLGDTQVEA